MLSSNFFHRRVAKPFWFFHTKHHGNIPMGIPLTGASNAGGGKQKLRFWVNIWLQCMLSMLWPAGGQMLSTRRHQTTVPQVVTPLLVSDGAWWCDAATTKYLWEYPVSLNLTPKTTEQHLIIHSDKSLAYVTNKKRLRVTFCTVEANYWQIRSIARPLCDSRATCSSHQEPIVTIVLLFSLTES